MSLEMDLKKATRYDPLAVFSESKTPPGLYARKRWLGESSRAWKTGFQETVEFLKAGQDRDGSWNQSLLETVKRLFGLHLTVRDSDEAIHHGLDWLLEEARRVFTKRGSSPGEPITNITLQGLPFTEGHGAFFLWGATLFLSTIFGRQKDLHIISLYKRLEDMGKAGRGRWCNWSCSNNILRAFVVHPEYAKGESVALAVKALSSAQEPTGRWPRSIPFYQTLNALAHLSSREANAQIEKAFEWLYTTQNRDGTWGRSDREWKTFLVIHALKNKGVL
jgi:hypothetical protein